MVFDLHPEIVKTLEVSFTPVLLTVRMFLLTLFRLQYFAALWLKSLALSLLQLSAWSW